MFFNFNSHAHVERDRRYFKRQICNFISTHTLTWSVTCYIIKPRWNLFNFNSHAHVERDKDENGKAVILKQISTHTLTWSVTMCKNCQLTNVHISTHTLTWSVTISSPCTAIIAIEIFLYPFQLTRSRGAWLFNGKEWNTEKNFNSHAHVERDGKSALSPLNPCDFNSHAHVERDETSSFYDGEDKNFNSHAHVERDAFSFFFVSAPIHFNSHAHVERDVSELRI